jgi:hypothetical protein
LFLCSLSLYRKESLLSLERLWKNIIQKIIIAERERERELERE